MKKNTTKHAHQMEEDLRPEYDFSGAVRGKHYHPLHEGYTIKIHKADGTTEVQQVIFEAGTVRLEPDVQEFFPDSQAVNSALRSLIALVDQFPKKPKRKRTSRQKTPLQSKKDVAKSVT